MAGNDGFLYSVPSDANPNDGRLRDPTTISAITGTGALVAGVVTLSGVGLSISTGTGALAASASSIAGEGIVSSVAGITGSGELLAQAVFVSGVGISSSTGTGALLSSSASAVGVGISLSTGTGSAVSQNASAAGVGITQWVARGGRYLQEDGVSKYQLEDLSGFYARENPDLVAQPPQVSGEGTSSSTGTGVLLSSDSMVSGIGFTPVVEPAAVISSFGGIIGVHSWTTSRDKIISAKAAPTPAPLINGVGDIAASDASVAGVCQVTDAEIVPELETPARTISIERKEDHSPLIVIQVQDLPPAMPVLPPLLDIQVQDLPSVPSLETKAIEKQRIPSRPLSRAKIVTSKLVRDEDVEMRELVELLAVIDLAEQNGTYKQGAGKSALR